MSEAVTRINGVQRRGLVSAGSADAFDATEHAARMEPHEAGAADRQLHGDAGVPPALQQLDTATAWLYTPHTVSVLFIVLALICTSADVFGPVAAAAAATQHAAQSTHEAGSHMDKGQLNAKKGVLACILVWLGYSVTHGPRTSMVRPHPVIWRLVHGCLVVYILLLVYLVYQDVGDARAFLRHLHPDLGRAVSYRSYAVDCRLLSRTPGGWRLNWQGMKSTLFDEFVLAHLLGWWAKALIIRNRFMLWVVSIGFELMELTFAHMLPNFNECWWDSWVLDVALCNAAGIVLGMATVQWAECKYARYNWQGLSQLRGLGAKARRSLAQLGPYSWDHFEWCQFSSPKRFLQALFVVVLMLAIELNAFFLKFALWVPPANPLNAIRLLLWVFLAIPAVREWYEFIDGRHSVMELGRFVKLGPFAWIAIAATCLETMLSVKFGRGLYPNPCPQYVLMAWGLGAGAMAVGLSAWQLARILKARSHHGAAERVPESRGVNTIKSE